MSAFFCVTMFKINECETFCDLRDVMIDKFVPCVDILALERTILKNFVAIETLIAADKSVREYVGGSYTNLKARFENPPDARYKSKWEKFATPFRDPFFICEYSYGNEEGFYFPDEFPESEDGEDDNPDDEDYCPDCPDCPDSSSSESEEEVETSEEESEWNYSDDSEFQFSD